MNFENNYSLDNVMSLLRNGKSIEDIAGDMSSMLNEAERKLQEKEASRRKENSKLEDANLIAAMVDRFLRDYYPDVWDAFIKEEITGEDWIAGIEGAEQLVGLIDKLF